MNNTKFFTTGKAAEYLGVTRQTIINWSKTGKFKETYRTPGNQRLYTKEQLDELRGIAPTEGK